MQTPSRTAAPSPNPDPVSDGPIEQSVRTILSVIGEDPDRPGLVDSPARVRRMRKVNVGKGPRGIEHGLR